MEGGRVETQEEHDEHRGVNGTNSNQIIKFNIPRFLLH